VRKSPLALLIVAGPVVVLTIGVWLARSSYGNRPLALPASGPLTIALAGDVLLTGSIVAVERDPAFTAIRDLVRSADFAAANLEMNLLGREELQRAQARPAPRWPFGSERDAATLRSLGFHAISLANDHAADYGPEAIASTIRILDGVALLHAGTGADLAQARAPGFAGAPPAGERAGSERSRVAFVSVAASSLPEARAAPARGDIAGRPGLSALRYRADITVDGPTFQTLKQSMAALNAGPPAQETELTMFGTPIKKGDRTSVEFVVDDTDERAVLAAIEAAARAADLVIVSIHAHEPSNASDEPAEFVRRFARAAIDRGASIVVGHGPHRVRGIETYGAGAILYSLGNFLYQTDGLDFRAANVFDAGTNLYEAAVGASGGGSATGSAPPSDPAWWEGALALATFDMGRLVGLRIVPLELGRSNPKEEKGMPRKPPSDRAASILNRVSALSPELGQPIEIRDGVGLVRGGSPNR
jgi:poly-gamma-glutamate synthesis protein (capsule biosynthesis protein)